MDKKEYLYAKVTPEEEAEFGKYTDSQRQYQYITKVIRKHPKYKTSQYINILKRKFGSCLISGEYIMKLQTKQLNWLEAKQNEL